LLTTDIIYTKQKTTRSLPKSNLTVIRNIKCFAYGVVSCHLLILVYFKKIMKLIQNYKEY